MDNPKIHAFSLYVRVTTSNKVVVRQRVFAYLEGNPQNGEELELYTLLR